MERLFRVQKEHYRVWKTIGTELGVDVDTLNAIEKDHANDKDCLHAVIDSANPAPTCEAMAEVLQSANIQSAMAGINCTIVLMKSSDSVWGETSRKIIRHSMCTLKDHAALHTQTEIHVISIR